MFTFAHFSDIHLPPLPPVQRRQLLNKRVIGYLSWQYKRKAVHRRDILQTLIRDVQAQQPDHLCITGDLVNIALPAEFTAAKAWLEGCGTPNNISVIPGNHDAYVRAGERLFRAAYASWMVPSIPYVHRRGPIAFIGLSTAIATPPFMAFGRLGRAQCAWLAQTLRETREQGLVRVVMLHHPPQPHARAARKGLADARRFRTVIANYGAEVILHGHLHHAVRTEIAGPQGPVPIFGAGSASYIKAQYYIFRYANKGLEVESRIYEQSSDAFITDIVENLTINPQNL